MGNVMTRLKCTPVPSLLAIALMLGACHLGCGGQDTPPPAPTLPGVDEVSADMGTDGGSVTVVGPGALRSVTLTLPAGVLAQQETATLTLARSNQPQLEDVGGSEFVAALSLEIGPTDLHDKVFEALEATYEIDPAELEASQRASLLDDPVTWARQHLLAAAERDDEADHNIAKCSSAPDEEVLLPVHLDITKFAGVAISNTVKLKAPLRLLGVIAPRHIGAATSKPGGKTIWDHWNVLTATHSFSSSHPHFGPLEFNVYDVSITKALAEHSWSKTDGATVETCLKTIVHAIGDKLGEHFDPVAVTYDGNKLPYRFQIYDYSASSSTQATTNYPVRTIYLPTSWVDPQLYAKGCINVDNAEQIAVLAHELFHLQQGHYFLDQNDPAYFMYGFNAWYRGTTTSTRGEYALDNPHGYRVSNWIGEGSANWFKHEMMRSAAVDVRRGLANFPMDEPPWQEINGRLYVSNYWDYTRHHFFKFMTDREQAGAAQENELALMAELFAAIRTYVRGKQEQNAPASAVDFRVPIKTWLDEHELGWFDFYREYALLRGCASVDGCPLVATERANPYGMKSSKGTDLSGSSAESDYWSLLKIGATDYHIFDDTPFLASKNGVHAGKTNHNPNGCAFDTVKPSLVGVEGDAKAVLDKDDWVDIELPRNIQHHLSGVRIDLLDNLEYQEDNRYTWRLELDPACSGSIRHEAWRRTAMVKTLEFASDAKGQTPLVIGTKKAEDGSQAQYTTFLLGNEAWAAELNSDCKARLRIKLDDCPCQPIYQKQEGGGADDLVMYCAIPGDTEYAVCTEDGFVEGASTLLNKSEWQACWFKQPLLASFCNLAEDAVK